MKLYKPNYNEYTNEEKFRIKEAAPNDAVVKVNGSLINKQFNRNDWVKLRYNENHIYRIIRGASVKDLTQDKVWINYDSELDISNVHDCEIKIAKATFFEQYVLAPWNTPNIVKETYLEQQQFLDKSVLVEEITGIVY